jgi:hypothetical protein
MEHCMPCCQGQCPWCKKNILGDMDAHIQDEHPTCVGHVRPIEGIDYTKILYQTGAASDEVAT